MRIPDFIIGGAPRSGTTWLYAALDRHPGVYMAKPMTPEPKFFLVDELYAQSFDSYCARWFADVPQGCVAGEKSTNYLESPLAAQRIHEHMPQARLIFLLREPVDRAFSNWLWSHMNGVETESFEAALDQEEERERTVSRPCATPGPTPCFRAGSMPTCCAPISLFFQGSRSLCCVLRTSTRPRISCCPARRPFLALQNARATLWRLE